MIINIYIGVVKLSKFVVDPLKKSSSISVPKVE
jgi:hypothetical protein